MERAGRAARRGADGERHLVCRRGQFGRFLLVHAADEPRGHLRRDADLLAARRFRGRSARRSTSWTAGWPGWRGFSAAAARRRRRRRPDSPATYASHPARPCIGEGLKQNFRGLDAHARLVSRMQEMLRRATGNRGHVREANHPDPEGSARRPMMMKKTKTRTVLAALCGVLIAGPALADACLRPEERSAIEIRAMRSYLMVAALQCRTGQTFDAPGGYNAFLRRFGSDLSAADRVAATHFQRAYGGSSRGGRLDQYNTNLANEHSQDATARRLVLLPRCRAAVPPGGADCRRPTCRSWSSSATSSRATRRRIAPRPPPTPARGAPRAAEPSRRGVDEKGRSRWGRPFFMGAVAAQRAADRAAARWRLAPCRAARRPSVRACACAR